MEQEMKQQSIYFDANAVFELLALLQQQGQNEQIQMIQNLSSTIALLDNNLTTAMEELKAVKAQLYAVPKTTLKETAIKQVEKVDNGLQSLKNQLDTIKAKFIATAQNVVNAVKDTGIVALDKTSEFIHLKENLNAFYSGVKNTIAKVDKSIDTLNAVTQEANSAIKHIKNVGRAMTGKERNHSMAHPSDNVAKPLKAVRKMLVSTGNKSLGTISNTERLANRSKQIQAEKPSVLKKLKEQKAEKSEPKPTKAKEMAI